MWTRAQIARAHNVNPRTVGNWHERGLITGYSVPGRAALLFDPAEVDEAVRTSPHIKVQAKAKGPVVHLAADAVRVPIEPAL
jgi:hypothetical protein